MTDKNKKYVIVEFKDGLQIIPTIWLTSDLKRAKWPKNYITNKRYDKAVKNMEEPESTWEEYPIMKIFTSCSDYEVARSKLKLAEQLSDLNTCSDEEEKSKKSRKVRAAKKRRLSSTSNYSEESDESLMLSLPKPPCKQTNINRGISQKKNSGT
ncbi:uncharacterized protein LOC118646475 [Monomorium pharaonis]|uniref:uncharacterized protein LOC118646475 n=1 Tax=Monomorium pharaonis TaxID=307658 RepID=UPI00174669AF|nr:uncharacterized protein LOC118646475 [Monomorium pharaonis]